MALDDHLAFRRHFRPHVLVGIERLQQRAGRGVDEALHQRLVQLVGQAFFQAARRLAPVIAAFQPAAAIGDVAERAHAAQARRQGIDIAFHLVEIGDRRFHPFFRHAPSALMRDQNRKLTSFRCSSRPILRKSGNWQASHRLRNETGLRILAAISSSCARWRSAFSSSASLARCRPMVLAGWVSDFSRASSVENSSLWLRHCAASSAIKSWFFDGVDQVFIQFVAFTRHAERAIAQVTAGAAGDLADLLAGQVARGVPSNLESPEKATWATSMFRPMPMASVATRKSTSPFWNNSNLGRCASWGSANP